VCAIAGQVLNKNIGSVWLERDAICNSQHGAFNARG
jgi:hypothetical protein